MKNPFRKKQNDGSQGVERSASPIRDWDYINPRLSGLKQEFEKTTALAKEVAQQTESTFGVQTIMIEAGTVDHWETNFLRETRAHIPSDCTTINIERYKLSLIGIFSDTSSEFFAIEKPGSSMEFDYQAIDRTGTHRIKSLFTQDGRIYVDRDLITNPVNGNYNRGIFLKLLTDISQDMSLSLPQNPECYLP